MILLYLYMIIYYQANVHAIIQSDERVQSVVERIDKALSDLDNMDSWLSLYAAELNVSKYKNI